MTGMAVKRNTRGRGRGRSEDGSPNPVDVHVGGRIRLRRTLLGFSQEKLGERIGLTFQQIQKYERGANRVGASRLYDLAHVLEVPVGFFFDDMPAEVREASPAERQVLNPPTEDDDPLYRRETLELVRAYYGIDDPVLRKKIFELIKSMAADEEPEAEG